MSLCDWCEEDCSDGRCVQLPRIRQLMQGFAMREELSGRLEYEEVNNDEKAGEETD